MNSKTCSKCKTEKPLSEFFSHAKAPDGKQYICKTCNKAKTYKSRELKKQAMQQQEKPTKPPAMPARPLAYQPLKASDFEPILRPGALDHEKHGSLQADGSIHPYRKPRCEPSYYQPQSLQPRLNNGKFSNG